MTQTEKDTTKAPTDTDTLMHKRHYGCPGVPKGEWPPTLCGAPSGPYNAGGLKCAVCVDLEGTPVDCPACGMKGMG